MALPHEQRGEYVERFIADLSSMFFLNDFVFRKPSYVTGGHKREVTDLLLVLNQECILISVKGTDGEEKTDDRFHFWVQKKAGQASNNAKVACQRTARLEISGINLWGEERTFPAGSLTPVCGIGLVECSQDMFGEIALGISTGGASAGTYPVHTLSINDFLNIAMLRRHQRTQAPYSQMPSLHWLQAAFESCGERLAWHRTRVSCSVRDWTRSRLFGQVTTDMFVAPNTEAFLWVCLSTSRNGASHIPLKSLHLLPI